MTRPSTRCAVMDSSETSTCRIAGSVSTAVLIPRLNDEGLVLDDYPSNLVQLSRREASVPAEDHRCEPELRFVALASDVHVNRFPTVEAVEEQPIGTRD